MLIKMRDKKSFSISATIWKDHTKFQVHSKVKRDHYPPHANQMRIRARTENSNNEND